MKLRSFLLSCILLAIGLTGSMCAKQGADDDSGSDSGGDGYVEPVLKPTDTWVYMTMSPPLDAPAYNNRPPERKWIATNLLTTITSGKLTGDTTKNVMGFGFENTDKLTRFLKDTVNPGGRERLSMTIRSFNPTPGPGNYTMDIDYQKGYCWFDVFKANGDKRDSTRTQSLTTSNFNVTKMTLVSTSAGSDIYNMTGVASIEVMYWPNNTSSTTDIHHIDVTFNNVPIIFLK